jgi:hypothetical protein
MNGNINGLIAHLKRFVDGCDRSVDWAKMAESLIDELGDIDELLERFQDDLAFYRPGGGDHLLDESAIKTRCETLIKKYSVIG